MEEFLSDNRRHLGNALWVKEATWIKSCKKLTKLNLRFSSKNITNLYLHHFLSCLCPIFTTEKKEYFQCRKIGRNYSNFKRMLKTALFSNDLLKDENIDRPKKRLKKALLNKAVFNFKVENCVLQINVQKFLGWNIWQISSRPFFHTFCSEIERENRNMFISASANLSGIFGCDQNEGQGWIFHLKWCE